LILIGGGNCYNTFVSEFNEDFDGIRVTETNQSDNGWIFLVELGHGEGLIEYLVDVDRDFWTRLTNRTVEPADLVTHSFKFLLDREPKEVILKKFNLADISGYFPTYEIEIKKYL